MDYADCILQRGRQKRVHFKYRAAVVFLCFLLGGTSVYAGHIIYNRIYVNEEILPKLQPMEKIETKKLIAAPNGIGDYTKEYSSYRTLCADLGIDLLCSDFAENNPYMIINRRTDNQNWEEIRVMAYILGDIREIVKVDGENFYSYDAGQKYASPVDLTIEIISGEEQMRIGWDKDYLGMFAFEETYQSCSGYTVNILRDTMIEDKYAGYTPRCCAIFVADGIRYTLSGQVELETMKEIVDSMHYEFLGKSP